MEREDPRWQKNEYKIPKVLCDAEKYMHNRELWCLTACIILDTGTMSRTSAYITREPKPNNGDPRELRKSLGATPKNIRRGY